MQNTKDKLLLYADEEMRKYLQPVENPQPEGGNQEQPAREFRRKFKYVDGVERLQDMPLPFLVDLPNGSSEAVFLITANNAGCGLVPILE